MQIISETVFSKKRIIFKTLNGMMLLNPTWNEMISDRSKITSYNLSAKVLKRLDILQIEYEVIFEPTLK